MMNDNQPLRPLPSILDRTKETGIELECKRDIERRNISDVRRVWIKRPAQIGDHCTKLGVAKGHGSESHGTLLAYRPNIRLLLSRKNGHECLLGTQCRA